MSSADKLGPIGQLEQRLGTKWNTISQARQNSEAKRKQLAEALELYDSEDSSIVVYGSLARDEFTSGSDIDWTLLVDGIASPEHLDDALEITRYISESENKEPGREGTFGGLAFSHDLIHKIGGADDTNRNTTQRILLLLESAAIGRVDARERVIRNILRRYVHEDYGLVYSVGPSNVPRFLQNDIARYWRTVAVDFAYKQRQRADAGWALRVSKLRISRKLTYVSGLLMCFSCEFEKSEALAGAEDPGSKLHAYVDHLWKYTQKTPLDVVALTLLRYPQLDEVARKLFDAYDQFLGILNDEAKRKRLEDLAREKVSGDEIYESVRTLSHKFQEALTALFFDENGTELPRLTRIYGVF